MSETPPESFQMDNITWNKLKNTYPYIPEEDLRSLQDAGEDKLHKTNREWKDKIERELDSYKFPPAFDTGPNIDHSEVVTRMVVKVVGTSGAGKSAVCNTLFGRSVFEERDSAERDAGFTKTQRETTRTGLLHGCTLIITDTPSNWAITKNTVNTPFYVLVIDLENPQFDESNLSDLRNIKDDKNRPLKNNRCMLLLTHAKEVLANYDKTIVDYLERIQGSPLHDLIVHDLDTWKVMAINTHCKTEYEKRQQMDALFSLLVRCYKLADFKNEEENKCCVRCKGCLSFVCGALCDMCCSCGNFTAG